ncbi:RNase P/RNase MRP subunit p29 [Halovivax ruber XH-70]|uniref:Ribonuclease P protein component 1 n=1 Tax=Halovivax ruber (strain DSM 18193 / JCM 13892 / XH-70) TaxID=797302 RepID=L0IEZ8_HALRX|nr:ribonuclease P protein subunit [Halovivax ruber]AGB16552.1 RNase P/RNase MRP subunit p29 [Halovivax ruber XH-70]
MPLTPETLPRHELTGLSVRVVESDDPGRVGIRGRVVRETTSTLRIERASPEAERRESRDGGDDADARDADGARVVTVPKVGTTFEFAITDEAAGVEKAPGTASKLADTQPAGESEPASTTDSAGEGVAYVTVDGSRLNERPARRTETAGDSPWQ